jgi:hypothetical protein
MGGRGQEVEDEFTYYSDVSPNRDEEPESREEGGWWTPDPSGCSWRRRTKRRCFS